MGANKTAEEVEANSRPNQQESDQGSEMSPELLDPNDSNRLRDQIRGQTTEHASPPRLEDEGQSGG